ncbi:hypothetical protein NPIL_557941 [Nephila pilipes]|uniref:Uncharacterized protein n=1 Tax=Nephila pilipes TaxID=299642 RepID=A0A8X6UMP7_NEPPI|nr:hypothetical protein NPIL_557941 [Nephila pilipes]
MQKEFIRNGHTQFLLYNLMDTTNLSLKTACLRNDSVNLLKCSGCTGREKEKNSLKDMEKTSSTTSFIPPAHQRKPKNSPSFHLHGNAFLRCV